MAMDSATFAYFIWSLASAAGISVVGIASIRGGRSRPRGAYAFGLFALTWATQIVLGSIAGATSDVGTGRVAYALLFAMSLPTTYFLAEFAGSQSPPGWRATLPRLLAGGFGLAAVAVFFAAPALIFQGVSEADGLVYPNWGPLHAPFVLVPQFAAFGVALIYLYDQARRSPTLRTSRNAAVLLVGLGIYVSYASLNNLTVFLLSLLEFGGTSRDILLTLTFAALSLLTLHLVVASWRTRRMARTQAERTLLTLLMLSFAVPASWGAIEGLLAMGPFPMLNTVGLWRLAGVAVIAYGLARWRLYDLPQRTRKVAANAGGATLAAAGGAAAYGAGTLVAASAAVPVLAGFAVFGAALFPSLNFVRRFATKAVSEAEHDQQMYGQRIDTYRAALESSIARGTVEEDAEFLAALRERFGITEAEERVVLYYAKSSVVVARDTDAWGAYERLRLLGEGGAGRTWLSRDRARDRLVVLKEPIEHWQKDPNLRAHVLREARIAAKVRHPNVVAVEEVVEHQGAPIIVMEYLEGGSLADLLRRRGTLPWREAAQLALGVLRGLEAVHAAGIVHRDIKPSNILLAADGSPKVGDFGIALSPTAGGGAASARTIIDVNAPAIAGTPSYMAPEAREGAGDRRVDVYGGAAVLHECVFGSPPVPDAPVVQRNDLPPALLAVLARGLAARPEDRYASARAFADDLSRLVSSP
jgi:hypothetical protein